jgi:AraC-like DNA-binding protein
VYEERPTALAGAVAWTRSGVAGEAVLVLPDGCMDLLWLDDHLVVAGADQQAYEAAADHPAVVSGVRIVPGTAPALLATPAHVLRDQRVRLDDLWAGSVVRRLEDAVASSGPDPRRGLEAVATALAATADPVAPVVAAVVAGLRAGRPVAVVADEVGLSSRQLQRRALDAFGYGPKVLARVLRLQRALTGARTGIPFAQVAATTGYADQAHLAREVRVLTGTTLGRLVG